MKEEFCPLKITQASFIARKPVELTLQGTVHDSHPGLGVQQRSARCQTKIQLSLQRELIKVLPKTEQHCGLCGLSEVRGDHKGSASLDL